MGAARQRQRTGLVDDGAFQRGEERQRGSFQISRPGPGRSSAGCQGVSVLCRNGATRARSASEASARYGDTTATRVAVAVSRARSGTAAGIPRYCSVSAPHTAHRAGQRLEPVRSRRSGHSGRSQRSGRAGPIPEGAGADVDLVGVEAAVAQVYRPIGRRRVGLQAEPDGEFGRRPPRIAEGGGQGLDEALCGTGSAPPSRAARGSWSRAARALRSTPVRGSWRPPA